MLPLTFPVPVQGTPLQIPGTLTPPTVLKGTSGATGPDWPNGLLERSSSLDIAPLGTMMPVIGC